MPKIGTLTIKTRRPLKEIVEKMAIGASCVCGVYLLVLFLFWIGCYDGISGNNPVLLVAKVCFVHLVAFPILFAATRCWHQLYLPFLVINGIWLVGICVIVILLFLVLSDDVKRMYRNQPLNQMLLLCYFVVTVIIEGLVYLLWRQESADALKSEPTSPATSPATFPATTIVVSPSAPEAPAKSSSK